MSKYEILYSMAVELFHANGQAEGRLKRHTQGHRERHE